MINDLSRLDVIAVIFMAIVGVTFFGMSITAYENFDASCPSKMIRMGWAVLQTLGACMIAAAASYFVCVMRSGTCYAEQNQDKTGKIHFILFGVLFLITLGTTIGMLIEYNRLSNADKNKCDNSSNNENRTLTILLLTVSVIGLLASLFFTVRIVKQERDTQENLELE
jgi:heme/copper-type cytochrome/quinol oxidase subunit 2